MEINGASDTNLLTISLSGMSYTIEGIDTILCCCLTHDEAEKVLNDCHSGAYGGHLSGLATA